MRVLVGCVQRITDHPHSAEKDIDNEIIIIIIQAFVRRTLSASDLNLRRRQSLGGEDG